MIRTKAFRRAAVLLSVPAALALLPGPARAEAPFQVKIYGFVNAEVEQAWATGGATAYQKRGRLSDGNSRLGLTGTYDVAPGTQAVWQLEGGLNGFEQGGVNDRGSSATIVSRNSFVGVVHEKAGMLSAGHVDSAYRSLVGSGGALGGNLGLTTFGLDLWNNTSAQMTGNADSVFSRGEARYRNSVHYLSPDWIVRVGASYGFDEGRIEGRDRDRWSVAARLKLAGLQVGLGLDRQHNTGVNLDDLEAGLGFHTDGQRDVHTLYYKAVASYAFPTGTYVGVGREWARYGFHRFLEPTSSDPYARHVNGALRQEAWILSAAQSVGDLSVMASWAALGDLRGTPVGRALDYRATQYSLGLKYALGEHFAVYAYHTHIGNAGLQNVNLGQAPLYSNGAGTAGAYLAPGDSPRATGVGMIARF